MCTNQRKQDNESALQILSLSTNKKELFRQRYLALLNEYETRAKRYSRAFHSLRVIVGVGSLFVPALLSIQQVNGSDPVVMSETTKDLNILLYWATWILSLMVTMSNGMFTLFKVDKKYYFMHTLLEQLRSEGWQFMTLTGRYGIYRKPVDMSGVAIHDPAFGLFCHMVEKIKMHQVEEEYYKLTDDYTKQDKAAAAAAIATQQLQPAPSQRSWNDNDAVVTVSGRAPSPAVGAVTTHTTTPHRTTSGLTTRANTEMSLLPKTPQNNLVWEHLPSDIQELLHNIMPGNTTKVTTDPSGN